jgi:hypothetical protein
MKSSVAAFPLILLAGAAFAGPIISGDSTPPRPIGGFVLEGGEGIIVESQAIEISRDNVTIKYEYTNTTGQDIEAAMVLAMPDQSYREADLHGVYQQSQQINPGVTINGTAIDLLSDVKTTADGTDIGPLLEAARITPFAQLQDENATPALSTVDPDVVEQLVELGALTNLGDQANPEYFEQWDVSETLSHKQLFPAGETVSVELIYDPLYGESVGGGFDPEAREDANWATGFKQTYCVDNATLKGFDKNVAKYRSANNPSGYNEFRIAFAGLPNATPVKNFSVTIDKGATTAIVSFCGDDVKKISPTRFEMRKTNFAPTGPINIVIADLSKSPGGPAQFDE